MKMAVMFSGTLPRIGKGMLILGGGPWNPQNVAIPKSSHWKYLIFSLTYV